MANLSNLLYIQARFYLHFKEDIWYEYVQKKGDAKMPYVPSKKTDGKSTDREDLDVALERVSQDAATEITNNFSLVRVYKRIFESIAARLSFLATNSRTHPDKGSSAALLGNTIFDVGRSYGYEGAFLGELNYTITRFIQRVPQIKVKRGDWQEKDELRYWLYACTVEALTDAAITWNTGVGIGGVFEDIKDEYKRRVNTAYEAAQIVKSGDCYDAPYYTRLIEVQDEYGVLIGHQEIMLKRSDVTLSQDVLDGVIILKRKIAEKL